MQRILNVLADHGFTTAKGSNSWVLANIIKTSVDAMVEDAMQQVDEQNFFKSTNSLIVVQQGYENFCVYYQRESPPITDSGKDISELTGDLTPIYTSNNIKRLSCVIHDGVVHVPVNYFSISDVVAVFDDEGKRLNEAYYDAYNILDLADFVILPVDENITTLKFTNLNTGRITLTYVENKVTPELKSTACDIVRFLAREKFKLNTRPSTLDDISALLTARHEIYRLYNEVIYILPNVLKERTIMQYGIAPVKTVKTITVSHHISEDIENQILTAVELDNVLAKINNISNLVNVESPTVTRQAESTEFDETAESVESAEDTEELYYVVFERL